MNEVNYVDVIDCKPQGNFVKAICFKPKKAPIVCIVLGILMMIPNNLYVRLLGVFFIFMSFVVLKLVRDFKVMDIFDKGIKKRRPAFTLSDPVLHGQKFLA